MPKTPEYIRKPAQLAGAAALLVVTGCAQDDREYAPVPADSDYAWYVPDEVPGRSPSEPSDNSQIFVSSGCTITLSLYEDQTARFISEEEAAKYWMEMVAMQIGGMPRTPPSPYSTRSSSPPTLGRPPNSPQWRSSTKPRTPGLGSESTGRVRTS